VARIGSLATAGHHACRTPVRAIQRKLRASSLITYVKSPLHSQPQSLTRRLPHSLPRAVEWVRPSVGLA
jgi:hypothetical protein